MAILASGAQAPDFELESQNAAKVRLADFRGRRNVMLLFYPLDFAPT